MEDEKGKKASYALPESRHTRVSPRLIELFELCTSGPTSSRGVRVPSEGASRAVGGGSL